MRNILAKELKNKFIEVLSRIENFSYQEGNPFLIQIGSDNYYIFLKNLSPAYFKKSPDVTRVQLPVSEHFEKIFKSNITFIILGYDVDNDTVVCWNPSKIKNRLNAKNNVSLYSRNSLQTRIKIDEFITGYLSTGEKIILFNIETLPVFFNELKSLFDLRDNNTVNKLIEVSDSAKLTSITDETLLNAINPILKNNRVLEAVEMCTKFYANQFSNMSLKDWFQIVNEIHKK